MRLAMLLALSAAAAAPAGNPQPREFVQAVDFPYYLCPRPLWERELVWLKNIGVRTVEFSIPWNWHQVRPGEFDFSGATSPRRDLSGFVKLLRRLGLRAWIRPLPPLPGWRDDGPAPEPWLKQLTSLLATQTASHGGPIAWVEGKGLTIDAVAPPGPVASVSATDPAALARSREVLLSARGSLLWTNVEDKLYPLGWQPAAAPPLVAGAVGLSGDERPSATALRRSAALLRKWEGLLPSMRPAAAPKPPSGKLPEGVEAAALVSPAVSAISITNHGSTPFRDDLRVFEPLSRRTLVIPGVVVPPGESLWLPLSASLGADGLCPECSNFSATERLVYATAELLSIEFENGILAMEFSAPVQGEAILQLTRQPVGPFLASGTPTKFDWDDKSLRARLTIPASTAPDHRVRIGIAIEEPETSAFFNDAHRLIVGQPNTIRTSYSSAGVASRSRLRLPEGFTAVADVKSPNEIEYQVSVPADALHGDFASLALEADGMPLGRARLQLFRPFSIRIMEAMQAHFGQHTEIAPEPPTAAIEPRLGTNLEVSIRNNWPSIQTYRLESSGEGLEFAPAKTEISIGAQDERRVSLRVFAAEGLSGLRDWRLHVTGAGEADLPMRVLLLPRGRTVAWSADLYGDGGTEWVLESHQARAVFSAQDGGRWMEFTARENNANFLPEAGLFAVPGPVTVRDGGDALEFVGKGWQRNVRLSGASLVVEQTTPLAADGLKPDKQGGVALSIERTSPNRAVYTLK